MTGLDRSTILAFLALSIGHAVGQQCPGHSSCCPGNDIVWNQGQLSVINPNGVLTSEHGLTRVVHDPLDGPLFVAPNPNCQLYDIYKASFTEMGPNVTCMGGPRCGRRILRIDFNIHRFQNGENWVFEIGNQEYYLVNNQPVVYSDTSLMAIRGEIVLRKSGRCGDDRIVTIAQTHNASLITVYIAHHFLKVQVDFREVYSGCWSCLWNLNKTPDLYENSVLIAINSLINTIIRGNGICTADFRWVCPTCLPLFFG